MTKQRYSYTALDSYNNCPRAFFYKYIDGKRAFEQTLALELGTLLHKVRELNSLAIIEGKPPMYDYLREVLEHGWRSKDKSSSREEVVAGLEEIKKKYWEEWCAFQPQGISSYDERVQTFLSNLSDEQKQADWKPIAAEQSFAVSFGGVELFGVIDKVEQNNSGELRLVDYKSSKKPYDASKLASPLQFYIYYLAAQKLYPNRPIKACIYDFIAVGEQREIVGTAWLSRCERKLQKLIDKIQSDKHSGVWKPQASPLCYFCPYCALNPKADEVYKHLCEYYSLWTPERKTFEKAKIWIDEERTPPKRGFWF